MKNMFDLNGILNEEILESENLCDLDIDDIVEESGNNEIPEQPAAKLEGDTTNQLPGSEQPATRPKDETKIMTGNGTEIKADVYNSAMGALKKSFKEASELIDMLSNCTVVESTTEDQQRDFTEAAIMRSYEDGPYFEKVDREDKEEVKKITRKLRKGVAKCLASEDIKYAPLNRLAQLLNFSMYGWQIVGVAYIGSDNVSKLANRITEKFKDDLGEYKILPVAACYRIVDGIRVGFDWRNTLKPYLLIIDRKLSPEMKKIDTEGKKDQKENK